MDSDNSAVHIARKGQTMRNPCSELKPCPFCGREPKIEECEGWGYFIICECGIEQSELYKQKCDAVKHWNRRKGMLVGKHADFMMIDEACAKGADDDSENI